MKKLVQLNLNKDPIAVFTTYKEFKSDPNSENYIELENSIQVDAITILKQWRYSGGVFKNVGPPPEPYYIWDLAASTWIDPRTPETEWPLVRADRDRRLLASDWTQLPDVPLATKEAWATYRQALRDITQQPDPFNIVWPTPPT